LLMEQLPTGCSIELFYKMNKAGGWTRAYAANGDASYSTTNGKKAVFRIGAEGDIFEHKILLTPSFNLTPTVLRSRTYFD